MPQQPTSLAVSLFLAFAGPETEGDKMARGPETPATIMTAQASIQNGGHLSASNNVRDILNHPAFAGFGRLLLPWDNRTYDEDMRLSDLSALLPYHSHVTTRVVIGALNRMIDDASDGKPIFYDFYNAAQRKEQPAKANAGLFFFRGKPGAPFAVISPGGGFAYVGSIHEGFPYAAAISANGYNAFVLRYRAGYGGAAATEDLAAAISFIFRNTEKLGISTEHYSLWGSSAGARMAAAIGTRGVAAYGGDDLPKPSAVVMAYTAHSGRSSEPPTFAVVGEQDAIASPVAMERRITALRNAGTEVEFHTYQNLGHGFGLGSGTSAEGWIDKAVRFWERFMTRKK